MAAGAGHGFPRDQTSPAGHSEGRVEIKPVSSRISPVSVRIALPEEAMINPQLLLAVGSLLTVFGLSILGYVIWVQ